MGGFTRPLTLDLENIWPPICTTTGLAAATSLKPYRRQGVRATSPEHKQTGGGRVVKKIAKI